MTEKQINLCTALKRLGFSQGGRMKLYGEEFEFLSGPIVVAENVVLVDATERKSGESRRVRISLPIVKMANRERTAA
jgi:hypothetical protein